MVEPSFAGNAAQASLTGHSAGNPHVRQAVVIACRTLLRALAAHPLIAIDEHRLRFRQREIESEIFGRNLRNVSLCRVLERPSVDPDPGITLGGAGKAQRDAANFLIL